MNKLFLMCIFLGLGLTFTAKAQVQLRVVLHPLASLEIAEDRIHCEKKNKDLLVSVPLETFIVPQGELLRFELMHLDTYKKYAVSYNEGPFKAINHQHPELLVYPKVGNENHLFVLRISNAKISSCQEVIEHIRLSLEPL